MYPLEVREVAALVASKVYYHLASYEDSLNYALGAGSLFDLNARTQYVETIISKCIDSYTAKRVLDMEVNILDYFECAFDCPSYLLLVPQIRERGNKATQ